LGLLVAAPILLRIGVLGTINRRLELDRRLEWLPAGLPVPVRFSDGRLRLSTVHLRQLSGQWMSIPSLVTESAAALDAYSGGDVLDIGAFHGWYSVLLAPRAGAQDRVVSFEPDARAIPTLRQTLRDIGACFPAPRFEVIDQPVGDGSAVLATWPLGDAGHPCFSAADAPDAQDSLTVDHAVLERGLHPRLVKIDVEGAEWFVLQGMRDTLREHRPAVLLEVHPTLQPDGVTVRDVEAVMRDGKYRCAVLDASPANRRCLWVSA
jgi:FkbM family methyltransferase